MAKKIKLELTEPQFTAIIEIVEEFEAVIGAGTPDEEKARMNRITLFDRMLKKNGYKRQ